MAVERRLKTERRKSKGAVAGERRVARRAGVERRNHARAPLDLWVEEERGDELYFRRTGNISTGGLFFEQTIPHALGTQVRIRFTLPGDPCIIEAVGEVVSAAIKGTPGMGVSFVDITASDKQRLLKFVKKNAA